MPRNHNWKRDPVAFIREVLVNPETGKPFELYAAQERFIREAITPTSDGRLPFSELVFSAPKKSGKTTLAGMIVIYVIVCLGGPYGEGYCLANDEEQAQGRVFQAIVRIIQASPSLRNSAKITANRIEFTSTGAAIMALASDYAGAAGANPTIVVFDELWAYTSERSGRLWDEMIPVPTRKVSVRLTVTYAGFEGESKLLEDLYKRGLNGEEIAPSLYKQPGLLMYWAHEPVAPWQTEQWVEQMRRQHRPHAFLRHVYNQWVTSESCFVPMDWYDECVDVKARPLLTDPNLSVWVGVDASTKRDSTAIVACTFDFAEKKIRLIWHRIFQPSPQEPLDFESTVERTLLELKRRFAIREIRFDPFQMQATAQRLTATGLPMVEVAQVTSSLTESSTNLYELLKGRNIIIYPDEEIRLAVSHTVALETPRGWRIAKEKARHKIDVVVALAMSALAAVQQGQQPPKLECLVVPVRRWSARWQETSVSDRLYARGEDVAAEEDLQDELKRLKRRRHDRWYGF
jgi:phage terminase large subunit-like protein